MNISTLVFPAVLGMASGVIHYGGLWLTVRRVPRLRHPGLWWRASLFLRVAVLSASAVAVVILAPSGAFAALFGFLLARSLLLAMARRDAARGAMAEQLPGDE